jgi:hypothetical protein
MQANSNPVAPATNASASKAKNKFNIDDKAYVYNVSMQSPLVMEFLIVGIISNDEGLFYTHDRQQWVKEEYLYRTRKEAYKSLIAQAENELQQPEGMQK